MCYCENNYIKIHDFGKDSGYGRFFVIDESGMKGMTSEEARQHVEAFFREREKPPCQEK